MIWGRGPIRPSRMGSDFVSPPARDESSLLAYIRRWTGDIWGERARELPPPDHRREQIIMERGEKIIRTHGGGTNSQKRRLRHLGI